MEPNKNPAQLYLIQLDPNITTEVTNTQVVPLHLLENVLGQDILLPVAQPKQPQIIENIIIKPAVKSIVPDVSRSSTLNQTRNIPRQNTFILNREQTENYYLINNDLSKERNESFKYSISTVQDNQQKSYEAFFNSYNKNEEPLMYCQDPNKILKGSKMDSRPNSSNNQSSHVTNEKVADNWLKLDNNGDISPSQKSKSQNYIHISDTKMPPRAIAVLPSVLQIHGNQSIVKHISPKRTLSGRRRFGPVQGIHKRIALAEAEKLKLDSKTPLFLLKDEDGFVTHIDVSDKDKSNWIGLLPLGDQSTANVWLYEEDNKLYGITTEPIRARQPLNIGYSKKFVEEHKLPSGVPVLDLDKVLTTNPKQWWCNECHRALSSASLLQRHVDVYHKDYVLRYRRSIHRCTHCRRTFSRLFTLRRHLLLHCTKKTETKSNATKNLSLETILEESPQPEVNASINSDDNRLPSDESFHNFSNNLDFSTNLFDTDRIDISGHSRTDADFNLYSVGLKDDGELNNDLGLSKQVDCNSKKDENILETCKYCKAVVVKENKRKHLSSCPSRVLTCSCGLSFTHKKRLALHIHKKHPTEQAKETNKHENNDSTKKDQKSKNQYKCEHCELSFKRRGMLCNHSWRVHGRVWAAPVARAVRRYPCALCHKLYRTKAKRDLHRHRNHPGAASPAEVCVDAGVSWCEAACCPACPRQYATRAKLLQHMRQQHPGLAPAIKVPAKSKAKTDSNKVQWPTDKQVTSTGQQPFVYY